MMDIDYHTISAVALGIALSACCGFRVFIPLLINSITVYNHWFVLPGDMHWMGSGFSVTCFAAASVIEVGAYYFPFLDNILDTVAAPLAVAAGTLLAHALIPFSRGRALFALGHGVCSRRSHGGHDSHWYGHMALIFHQGYAGHRQPGTGYRGNAAAIAGAIASFFIPLIMSIVMLPIVGWFAYQEIIRATTPGKKQPAFHNGR